jgi:hypothetical protein
MASITIPADRGGHMADRWIKRAAEHGVTLDPHYVTDEAGQATHWAVAHPDLTEEDGIRIRRACALKAAGQWPHTTLTQARAAIDADATVIAELAELRRLRELGDVADLPTGGGRDGILGGR